MKLLISLSAPSLVAGDRVAVEFDKNDWALGTVVKPTPTGTKIDFDYGEQKLVKTGEAKIVPVTSKKKIKKPLTLAEVRALKTTAIPKAAPAPKAKAAPAAKPTTIAKKIYVPHEQEKSFVGSVVKSRFGDIAILTSKYGRKYIEYKWSTVSGKSMTGWLKRPIPLGGEEYDFRIYPFVRMATKEEMSGGHDSLRASAEKKATRLNDAVDKISKDDIKPGDVVLVKYSNGAKKEAVLEVDWKSGQLAIVRQQSGAASIYSKRRLLPASICTKVADGGGKFDPNNPIYSQHGIYVPQFYKDGNTVAPRRSRNTGFGFRF